MTDLVHGFSIPVEVLIGVVGILFTIFVSYFFYRIRSRASRISLVCSAPIELFHSIVREVEGVDISYNEESISESLTLVGFLLLNTGSADIKLTDSDKPVTFRVPEHYKWKEFNIIHQSDDVDCRKVSLGDEEAQVKWDVLKKGEMIRFNALVEQVPNDEKSGIGNVEKEPGKEDSHKFVKHLEVLHRIPNTIVRKVRLNWTEVESSWPKFEFKLEIFFSAFILIPATLLFLFSLFYTGRAITKMGYIIDQGPSVDTVYIASVCNDSVEVKSPPSDSTYFLKRSTFEKNSVSLLEIKYHASLSRSIEWVIYVAVALFVLTAGINVYIATRNYRYAKRLLKIFQKQPHRGG